MLFSCKCAAKVHILSEFCSGKRVKDVQSLLYKIRYVRKVMRELHQNFKLDEDFLEDMCDNVWNWSICTDCYCFLQMKYLKIYTYLKNHAANVNELST